MLLYPCHILSNVSTSAPDPISLHTRLRNSSQRVSGNHGQAEDTITFSRDSTDTFLEYLQGGNEVLKSYKVRDGVHRDDMISFGEVLSAAYAVYKSYPVYELAQKNCYFAAWEVFGLLENRARVLNTYDETPTAIHPGSKRKCGTSGYLGVRGYSSEMSESCAARIQELYTRYLDEFNIRQENYIKVRLKCMQYLS
jgi:hypothetical protein